MTHQVNTSLGKGEEWWRVLPTTQKAAILKPYFDADGRLPRWRRQQSNVQIAGELQIHVSSVAFQRSRYLTRTGWSKEERPNPPTKKSRFLIDGLTVEAKFQPPPPKNRGLSWWWSLSPGEKKAVIRPLVEVYQMTTTGISEYLGLETRGRVAGIRFRLYHSGFIYLDAPISSDSTTTRHNFLGVEDPGFAKVESLQLLQALLDKRRLADDATALLKRIMLGDDLENEEYQQLASAIRQHPELLKILEHL